MTRATNPSLSRFRNPRCGHDLSVVQHCLDSLAALPQLLSPPCSVPRSCSPIPPVFLVRTRHRVLVRPRSTSTLTSARRALVRPVLAIMTCLTTCGPATPSKWRGDQRDVTNVNALGRAKIFPTSPLPIGCRPWRTLASVFAPL